jgi:hypothetical protein
MQTLTNYEDKEILFFIFEISGYVKDFGIRFDYRSGLLALTIAQN